MKEFYKLVKVTKLKVINGKLVKVYKVIKRYY